MLPDSRLANASRAQSAGLILGFVAGFVDVAGYLALFGLFSANMTGNILLVAVELVQPRGDIALNRLVAVPLFMSGVLIGWLIAVQAKRRVWPVGSVLLMSEAIALTLFVVVGMVYGPQLQRSSQQGLIVAISAFSLIAMGLQNALARELSADMPTTTAMTNNLSLLILDGAALVSAKLKGQPMATNTSYQRFARIVPVFCAFLVGAMAGAYGMRYLGYLSVGVPIAFVVLLAVTRLRADTSSH
jgi:uncharacterized membrane protein YoaK (UPF0700 family)